MSTANERLAQKLATILQDVKLSVIDWGNDAIEDNPEITARELLDGYQRYVAAPLEVTE